MWENKQADFLKSFPSGEKIWVSLDSQWSKVCFQNIRNIRNRDMVGIQPIPSFLCHQGKIVAFAVGSAICLKALQEAWISIDGLVRRAIEGDFHFHFYYFLYKSPSTKTGAFWIKNLSTFYSPNYHPQVQIIHTYRSIYILSFHWCFFGISVR